MTVLRWHAHPDSRLRGSGDNITEHQVRVASLCVSLAARIGHPLHNSDLTMAALKHDEAERVLGDMPGPAKDRFPALAAAYAEAEREVMAEMRLSWYLTPLENDMLTLCDKYDAVEWAIKLGVRGPEWDAAIDKLKRQADKLGAKLWLDEKLTNLGI